MKFNIFLLTIFFISGNQKFVSCQPIIWQDALSPGLGGEFYNINKTYSDDIIAIGASSDSGVFGNHGQDDVWVVRLKSSGEVIWQKCYGGSKADGGYWIEPTKDRGFIFTGETQSNDGDVSGNHSSSQDIWVVKIDSTGNIKWQHCYGGSQYDIPNSIATTSDGGYIFTGYSGSNDGDLTFHYGSLFVPDVWVVKIDSVGNIQWQRDLGGTGDDEGISVFELKNKHYFLGCRTSSKDGDLDTLYNYGSDDGWYMVLDSSGNTIWQRRFGGPGSDRPLQIIRTNEGGFLSVGITSSDSGLFSGNHGKTDYWVVKMDSVGNILWNKLYGGSAIDYATCVTQCSNNNFAISGASYSSDGDISNSATNMDYWVLVIDSNGTKIWNHNYGGSSQDNCFSIIHLDDYIILAGGTFSADISPATDPGYDGSWIFAIDNPDVVFEIKAQDSLLSLFPNPASNFLRLSNFHTQTSNLQYSIINTLGKVKQSNTLTPNNSNNSINVSALTTGVYFIRLTNEKGFVWSGKFVKE